MAPDPPPLGYEQPNMHYNSPLMEVLRKTLDIDVAPPSR